MTVRTIETRTHGRYLVSRPPRGGALLVGFHGYAENAELQLNVLNRIAREPGVGVISIQALNRFYTKGNRVVAGWMTSQDRELAIADNIAYVSAVIAEVEREHGSARRLVYAGFSQGVAMAYRAAAFVPHSCDGLIVLAGDVPPDVAPMAGKLPRTLLGRGTKDEYYTPDKAAVDRKALEDANVDFVEHVFEGGHDWHESFIARAGAFLDERLQVSSK
jgi:predicted esterase